MIKVKNQKSKNRGFTLIELLVVIAIIGILSTLSIVALNNARQRARDAKRVFDIRQIQTALTLYFNDKNEYPEFAAGGIILGSDAYDVLCDTAAGFQGDTTGCVAIFKGMVPKNPTPNGADYRYSARTSAGAECTTAPCASYQITFTLEGTTGELAAGPRTATPDGIQ